MVVKLQYFFLNFIYALWRKAFTSSSFFIFFCVEWFDPEEEEKIPENIIHKRSFVLLPAP